ncbi:MAG TPA: hypothetical protein ENI31_04630 [Candidatus Omnitrophica bacterium]|nr:MAG: hypothetical protein DRP61_04980 [Candidatus Omnitrophota bacterium]RKY34892.1 MAG: hypothetical protein DRP69_03385 [Candidatus Omnitrophota bacterium]RKY42066.1 MAG: hypothetical protein DRP80_07200 [Candidatus Omnitrophota bacterium]HEC69549.1 hypothetical protein [Candidatus Omnitrophota bacterium]
MREEILKRDKFLAKRDVWTIGGAFRIMTPEGKLLLYSRQKLFRLKEDIRVYADLERKREVLHIQARQIIDFAAAYDVIDSLTREKIGVLRRRGFSSIFRDKWEILTSDESYLAKIEEDSLFKATIRRWVFNLIPQTYYIVDSRERRLAEIKQFFNPFIHKFFVDFSLDKEKVLDKRLGLAGVILLLAIEGRQR